jgi:ech hydrogenase subunit A
LFTYDYDKLLFAALILGPILFGALALISPSRGLRNAIVVIAAVLTAGAGAFLITRTPLNIVMEPWTANLATGLEFLIVLIVLAIAINIRSWLIATMALIQLGLAVAGQLLPGQGGGESAAQFVVDPLALILVLVVSIVGSVICVYAIGYMKHHEEHAPPTTAGSGRFFFFLVGFLGAMNGLVMANDLKWLAIFWEATTLCSFMLIGHDRTPEAKNNAKLALLINTFGGLAMMVAALIAHLSGHGENLSDLTAGWALLPMALLCLAALTKSAQLPFQSWLLGAMVAPTPVSALLHSATMVKAGSYLVLRLAPAFSGTRLAVIIAIAGAFTFAAASALAIGQSNGKKVLAYSTIANLGLIVTCAGIGTPLAFAAGIFVLCFHAASKGLLFMCIGAIEQKIGSRDIEEMGHIMFLMPVTTVITLIGMVSMLLPPLGMLMSKWLAIESAMHAPLVLFLLVVGSALTVFFWAKWIGRIQTASYHRDYKAEKLPFTILATLLLLVLAVLAGGLMTMPIFNAWIIPVVRGMTVPAWTADGLDQLTLAGQLPMWPFLVFLGLGLLVALIAFSRFKEKNVRAPFLCGENVEGGEVSYNFRSIGDSVETAWSASYYMGSFFTESRLTPWVNLLAWMVILTLFGTMIGKL